MSERLISIVIPVFNEEDSLEPLVAEIQSVANANRLRFEVIFVDDGSSDFSWSRIQKLTASDASLGGIRFRKNAGKSAALAAGFAAARGEIVVMMDADLQDPPSEIPRLIERLDQGYDLVSGWKLHRLDPWHKVYPSRVFNRLIGWATGLHLHDHVCGLKCFRREVVKELRFHGDMHRFLGVLAAARGFRVTELATRHRARSFGCSKYGVSRFLKGMLDLITISCLTRFRWRPAHLIGGAGLLIVLLTVLSWLVPVVLWPVLFWTNAASWLAAMVMGLVGLLTPAAMFVAVGLIAELTIWQSPPGELYIVAERIGWCADADGPAPDPAQNRIQD